MGINARTLAVLDQQRAVTNSAVDETTRDLTAAWVRAWNEIGTEWAVVVDTIIAAKTAGKPLSPAQIAQLARTQRALEMTGEKLEQLAASLGDRIEPALQTVVAQTAHLASEMAATQLPPVDSALLPSFTRVDEEALTAIVNRSLTGIVSASQPLTDEALTAVKSALIRAVPSGWHPERAAREMLNRTRGAFNGGLTRALRIARTELLDAHRYANRAQNQANPTVVGWVWTARLDATTCPSCIAQHGTVHDVDEFVNDHPNGRCTAVPKVMSWRDLGFDIDEPPDLIQPPDEWITQNPDAAISALGPERYQLLMDGRITLADLSTVRTAPDWRDSLVATPLSDLRRKAA